jgi:hypothetical protein
VDGFGDDSRKDEMQTASKTFTLTVLEQLVITTPTLPNVVKDSPYSVSLQASGGVAPYTWSFNQGSDIPAGISLNPATGAISGTPTVSGAFVLNVGVVDSST